MIFQLVNQVGGLPNIIYLLSMDKDIVVGALEKVQKCNGEEYLEKIVQVPFSIPKLDKKRIHELFFYKLDEIIERRGKVIFDENYWSMIYHKCVNPFLNTIRDVNRIINIFQFKYNLVADEVNFVDMIAITVLQVLKPDIYQWIIEHKDSICGSSYDVYGISYTEQNSNKKKYIERILNIGGEETLEIISVLFPKVDKEVNNSYQIIHEDELRKNKRMANIDKFELYFSLDISNIAVPNSVMIRSLNHMNNKEIEVLFDELNNNKKIISYLKELKSYIEEVPSDRISFLIYSLYKNMHTFEGETSNSIISITAERHARYCIDSLFKRVETQEKKYEIYNDIICSADFNTLCSLAEGINRIELDYGRLAGKGENVGEDGKFINIHQLEELEKMYVNRIKELIIEGHSIFECERLYFIVYLWKNFERMTCIEYFNQILGESNNILKFIIRMSSIWTGTRGRGWSFPEDNYKEFIPKEKIIYMIKKYFKGNIVEEFSDEEEAKLASFILGCDSPEWGSVTESEATKFIKKMKLEN